MDNDINEAPVTDAPAEDTNVTEAPVAEPSQDQATAEPASEATEATAPGTEAPQQDQSATNQDTSEDLSAWDSYLPKPTNRPNQPTVGEDGFIDPVAYKEGIKQEMRQEARFERSETKAWGKLEEKYPALAKDAELREIILAKRINDVQRGGDGSLIKSGEQIMKKFGTARNAGKADAQVSVRKQQSAGVSRSTAPRTQSSDTDVQQRIRSGDPEAVASVLSGWITDGKI